MYTCMCIKLVPRQLSFFVRKVTALGMLCWFALFVHVYKANVYMYMYVHVAAK